MSGSRKVSRRSAIQVGLGAAAGTAASVLVARRGVGASAGESGGAEVCATPEQTEGPFFPEHQQRDRDADMTRLDGRPASAAGEVVHVAGSVIDDSLRPVVGALIDIWQANAHGRYAHEDDPNPAPLDPNFQGWAQLRSDEQGRFGFATIVPGAYPVDEEWWRPPHIHFKVARRGYRELTTQVYFAGHALNDKDQLLQELTPEERARLIIDFQPSPGHDGRRAGTVVLMMNRIAREG